MRAIEGCGAPGVTCLYAPAAPGEATVAFFHGNGDQLATVAPVLAGWHAAGLGVLAVEYPGYGGTAGSPSEESIYAAARAALGHLQGALGVPRAQTVLVGQSLGTGVATQLASEGQGARLLLISPFTSIPDVGQRVFPFLPVRWLVQDRFDSLSKAQKVRCPVLVLHGTRDEVVPFALGERLAAAFPSATFQPVQGAGHNDLLDRPEVEEALLRFARR
jgi:pimeloyl-ACP methyl ester carboxylesterase